MAEIVAMYYAGRPAGEVLQIRRSDGTIELYDSVSGVIDRVQAIEEDAAAGDEAVRRAVDEAFAALNKGLRFSPEPLFGWATDEQIKLYVSGGRRAV